MHENHYEKEIDIRELFKIIWNKKVFILIVTFFITIVSFIYVSLKTPIYEVKSVVRIGYINGQLLDDSKIIEKKLRLIFNVENEMEITKDSSIVSNIKLVKNVDSFIEIYTRGFSNESALLKNKEVVSFIKNEYLYKLEQYKLKTSIDIKNIYTQIDFIENIQVKDINNKIDRIKNQLVPKIDNEIIKIKKQTIPKIEKEIKVIKTQQIVKIEKEIDYLKNKESLRISNQIDFYNNKLIEYEKNIQELVKEKSSNNNQNILSNIQLANIQNLVLNIQNNLQNLIKDEYKIKNVTLKDLENKKENLITFSIKDLNLKKENLLNINIKELENKKENLLNENIDKLNNTLNFDIPNKIKKLKNNILIKKQKLTNIKNSDVVGEVILNDNPVNKKKRLIVIVSFITGLILSIFIVFIMQIFSIKEND